MKYRPSALIVAALAALSVLLPVATGPSGNNPVGGVTVTASASGTTRSVRILRATATETVADFAYGTHPAQMLQATWQNDVTPASDPWVMLVHGGSWAPRNNPGRTFMGTATAEFRAAGFQVFSIDYRDYTQASWPAPRIDAANALIWIKAHAAQFGIDPSRGGVYGFSAGAQIAAGLGTVGAGGARTNAVIGVSGPYDLYQQWKAAYGYNSLVAGTDTMKAVADEAVVEADCPPTPTNSDCWSVYQNAYAGTYATADDAAFLEFHAQDDPAVSPMLSLYLHNRLVGAGASSTIVRPAVGGHAQAIVWGNDTRSAQAIQFMKDHTR